MSRKIIIGIDVEREGNKSKLPPIGGDLTFLFHFLNKYFLTNI